MQYKRYTVRGTDYCYFGCAHAKEQVGEGCCRRYVTEDQLNEIVWNVLRQMFGMAAFYREMKRYAAEDQLSQKMVQAFVKKVVVTDPEHVWKILKNHIF